ncbi:hypothetical protein [Flavobacterium sp. 25HG05S-40]
MMNLFKPQQRTIEEKAKFFEKMALILFGTVVVLLIVCGVLLVALDIK